MGDHYVTICARFCACTDFTWSQSLYRLQSPSDETIDRGPQCVYAHEKITYIICMFNSFKTPQNGALGSCRRNVFARLKKTVVNKLLEIIQ